MSTRRLIITALLCGLVILVAGGVQLFRIAGDDRVELPGLGERRTVSEVDLAPIAVDDVDGVTVVTIQFRTADDAAPGTLGDWTLLRGTTSSPVDLPEGLPAVPEGLPAVLEGLPTPGEVPGGAISDCRTVEVPPPVDATVFAMGLCRVAFDAPGSGARYLGYRRDGVEARWALQD